MLKRLFSTKPDEYVSPDITLLLLRIGAGGMIMTHGVPKLLRMLDGNFSFADPIGIGPELSLILAGFSEGILGFFILIGLATRISAVFCAFTMSAAAFFQHADDPFSGKEKSLLFLVMFCVLVLTGGGKYSVEKKISGKKPH